MSLAIVTMNDERFEGISKCSAPGKVSYCILHGYGFFSDFIETNQDRPTAWYKIKVIQKILPLCEWIFWSDADSVIWNPNLPLDRHIDDKFDVIVSKDLNGINMGNFFIRNTEFVNDLLVVWWNCPEPMIKHMWWEQRRFTDIFENSIELRNKTKVVEQKYFNSYIDTEETIIKHYPGYPLDRRLKLMGEELKWRTEELKLE